MKTNITKFIGEIAIIFIGITLSFLFEEYRENRKAEQDKKAIIRSLLTDINSKKEELTQDIGGVQQAIDPIDTCLYLSKQGKSIPDPVIEKLIWSLSYDYGGFETTTPSYVGLSSTGLWQQVPDTIRNLVFELYRGQYSYVENTILKSYEYVIHLKKNYFTSHHFEFNNKTTSTLRLESIDSQLVNQVNRSLKDPEFVSAVLLIRNERTKIIYFQRRAIAYQEKVIKDLKKYLEAL